MFRLGVTLLIMTVGSSGMYVVSVVLPAVQADFGVARAEASLPYTLLMAGFGLGGVVMGKLADRYGVMWPLLLGAVGVGTGFVASSFTGGILAFSLVQALFIGLGSGAVFAPLVADTSLWFVRRRGIAVAVCASGNYVAGALWPPVVQHFVETAGWRQTYIGLGVLCAVTMPVLALFMRPRPPAFTRATSSGRALSSSGSADRVSSSCRRHRCRSVRCGCRNVRCMSRLPSTSGRIPFGSRNATIPCPIIIATTA